MPLVLVVVGNHLIDVMEKFRRESDTMGEVEIPADALYGASTQRAVLNFQISNERVSQDIIKAYGLIKWAAADTNAKLGIISESKSKYIKIAAEEIFNGEHYEHFPVDLYQTGSGTSTNMNVNEVISNRCVQLAQENGEDFFEIHPNDDVNQSQSSNDTFPTAIHISALLAAKSLLLPELISFKKCLKEKALEMSSVIKIGRTHLMDATPITLGSEFDGFARQIELSIQRIDNSIINLHELALGGTAVGNGLNSSKEFAIETIKFISQKTGINFIEAKNHFEAQSSKDALVEFHGQINTVNVSLFKIANDIRLLGSGPLCNIGEIILPPTQPGSSIMPGKVNPVIPESVTMVAARVFGNQTSITWAGANGHLQLNAFMPIMAKCILESIYLTTNAIKALSDKCITGIKANESRCNFYLDKSLAMATALAPIIGYDLASEIAKKSLLGGESVYKVCIGMLEEIKRVSPDLDKTKIKQILNPRNMI